MKHTVWDNVDVMLLPENLGKLTGNTISSVMLNRLILADFPVAICPELKQMAVKVHSFF